MIVVKRSIGNPLELRAWFPPTQPVGTVFLPGVTDLQVGQEACIWLAMPSLGIDLHMVGTVIFRRLNPLPPPPPPTPPARVRCDRASIRSCVSCSGS